jgi:hypothetical protein
MRKNLEKFPRNCCERTHRVLTGTDALGDWKVNFKRVHRIWKEEHMQVPKKQRKRRRLLGASANGCVRHRATHRNHVWSYDFLTERTEDGRHLRILVVIDEFTRECLARACVRTPSIQKASPWDLFLSLPGSGRSRPMAAGLQPQAAAWRPEMDDPGGLRCRAGRYGLRDGPGGVAWCVSREIKAFKITPPAWFVGCMRYAC